MSGSGGEAFRNVREWSRGPLGCPGVLERSSKRSECSRGFLPDVREWWEDPPGCPVVVKSTLRMSGSGQEVLPDVREWS